jgi:5,5'-dehydrodivanillate O-demethylase
MLTLEEQERLTQTGAGTPMGNLLRRYWHPVTTAAKLDQDPVQPVRLLSENLTLYRDESGKLGLIGDRCAHRAISLAYGIPQANGLRCAYHGWTYNERGQVVDMPFEPACLPLKIAAYPVQELGGLIFAYLGPEPAPLLPRWDLLVMEDWNKVITPTLLPCNWLQCMDNSFDPAHFEHLHGMYGNYVMKKLGMPPMLNPARHLELDFEVFTYGVYKRRLLEGDAEDSPDWTIGHPVLFPNILAQGNDERMSFQFRVPVDDTHTHDVIVDATRVKPGEAPQPPVFRDDPLTYDDAGRVIATYINRQDEMAWVAQGPITDRTIEHLTTSDKGILLYRKLLLENIEKVERGEDPLAVVRDPEVNEPMIRIRRGSKYAAFRVGVEEENWGGFDRKLEPSLTWALKG